MLVGIVVMVVVGAALVLGALVAMSVADNHAGDRLRRQERERRLAGVRVDVAPTRRVRTRDVLAHDTRTRTLVAEY